jgi:RimJ/RimL family protein N-acetyltransferase
MTAPTLQTERLTLRIPVLADFEPRATFAASDRSIWEGGPFDRTEAWKQFAAEVGTWTLMGYGPFSMQDRTTGLYVGEVGIYHPVHFPQAELGWFVVPEAEGKGFAAEGARAVMIWARRTFGWDQTVNYIDPGNARSIALGLRLGGVLRPDLPGSEPGDVVILHDLRGLA